ncbi:MAG: hypothetical protein QNJ20_04980 [Paracoccaceae bacterium]|nr:hypothetical protein [Paracoccaceae bacterium]
MKTLALVFFMLMPTQLLAATFLVTSMASGGYGSTGIFEPFEPLVAGPSLASGETVLITATGEIGTGIGTTVGPNGSPFTFSGAGQSPLQEAGVAGVPTDQNSVGLMGYFVDAAELPVNAFDSERGGDLPASGLFFVGSELVFTAPSAGTLFFGINDPRASNNSGQFTVEVAAVPLPAGILLLGSGIVLLGLRRRVQANSKRC